MCECCSGTGRILCTTCSGEDGRPRGVIIGNPQVTCSSCWGFGYVNYSAQICPECDGKGYLNDDPNQICPRCLGQNSHSGVKTDDWDGFYTCVEYTTATDAIFECQLCHGEKEITDTATTAWLTCPDCSGYGQMADPACSGLGYIEDYEHPVRYSACPTCNETLIKCPECSGQGFTGDDPTIPCELCGGDKRVCSTCSGEATYTCPECNGTEIVPCPECIIEGETATCPLCSGSLIEGGVAYASTDDKEKILAYLPSGDIITNWSARALNMEIYASLLKNKCPICSGTGIDSRQCYSVIYRSVTADDGTTAKEFQGYVQYEILDHAPGYATHRVDTFEEASIFDNHAQAEYAGNHEAIEYYHETYEVSGIPKLCEQCGGGGGYDDVNNVIDKRIKCPCCNKLYDVGTTSYPTTLTPYKIGPMVWRDETFQVMYRDNLSLANNRYCGTPGKYYTVQPVLGYHTCDLCNGTQCLTWDEAREKLDGYSEDLFQRLVDTQPSQYNMVDSLLVGHKWFRNPGERKADGLICPKCMNMAPLRKEVLYDIEHGLDTNNAVVDYYRAYSGINMHEGFKHDNMPKVDNQNVADVVGLDGGFTAACDTCNYLGSQPSTKWGKMKCPNCVNGFVPCDACNGSGHWLCPTCSGTGEVKYRPNVAYEDGGVIKVGDGYFYKNLMSNQKAFNMYDDYINIKPENNCDLDIGQYLKRMNVFSVENHGMLFTHNNNYDEIPDSNVTHYEAADFFAVRSWAKYDSLSERFANLQNGCYSPDTIYFSKRTSHNEQWKLRIRELDYLIHDNYIKTNASMLKTAALNKAISDFYKKNNTFLLRLGPIITYRWDYIKGSKGAKGTKGWKGRKGIKGVTLGLKGKKGLQGLKGLKGTKGYKGMELKILDMRYKFYIEDILKATKAEFGKYISNNGNLGKNPETYTFYCVNCDPTENLYFKGVRLRKMANGNYQTLNAVKGIRPAEVQRILYKDNGYYGEYGVMNFNYAYNNKFLT